MNSILNNILILIIILISIAFAVLLTFWITKSVAMLAADDTEGYCACKKRD